MFKGMIGSILFLIARTYELCVYVLDIKLILKNIIFS